MQLFTDIHEQRDCTNIVAKRTDLLHERLHHQDRYCFPSEKIPCNVYLVEVMGN